MSQCGLSLSGAAANIRGRGRGGGLVAQHRSAFVGFQQRFGLHHTQTSRILVIEGWQLMSRLIWCGITIITRPLVNVTWVLPSFLHLTLPSAAVHPPESSQVDDHRPGDQVIGLPQRYSQPSDRFPQGQRESLQRRPPTAFSILHPEAQGSPGDEGSRLRARQAVNQHSLDLQPTGECGD